MVEFSSGLEFMIGTLEKPPLYHGFNENWLCSLWFCFSALPGCMVYVAPSPSPKMLIMVVILGRTITDEKNWMDFPSSLDGGSNAFQKAWSRNAAAPLWLVSYICCPLAPAGTSLECQLHPCLLHFNYKWSSLQKTCSVQLVNGPFLKC